MDILRAPVDSPFTTDQLQFLISPAWLAYFLREITPALNALIDNMDPPNVPMEFGKDYPRQSDGSGLILGSLPASIGHGARDDGSALNLPIFARRLAHDSPVFPPSAPRAPHTSPPNDLVMAAAIQFGRSLPIWVASDTAANITKYPASAYPPNALFFATDTDQVYIDNGSAWVLFPLGGQVITTPTVSLQIGGSATGITGTQSSSCVQTGKNVLLSVAISLTNKGSGSGAVTLSFSGLPVPAMAGTAIVSDLMNMLGLTSSVDAYLPASVSEIFLNQTGATGTAGLTDINLTNTSSFNLTMAYQSV